jgi:hypothetical protein
MYDPSLSEPENEAFLWQADNRIRIEHSMMEFFRPEDYRIVTDVMMRRYRDYFQHELEARHFFDVTFDPLSNMVGLTVEQFESRAQARDLVSCGTDVTRTIRFDDLRWHVSRLTNAGLMNVRFRTHETEDEGSNVAFNHPSDAALIEASNSQLLTNCPISAEDIANARVIYGQCKDCAEGKPYPLKGRNETLERQDIIAPGQLIHIDIAYVNGIPFLFSVDDFCRYMHMIRMTNKSALSLQSALLELILYYRGHLKVVQTISADHESTILACASFVNSYGATLRSRIPGEHKVDAERGMRTVRESCESRSWNSRQTIRSLMPSFHGSRWIASTPGTSSLIRVRLHGCPKRLSRVPRSTFGRT